MFTFYYFFFRSDENSEKNDENEVEEQAAKIQPEPEATIMSSKEFQQQQPDLNTFTGVLMASKSWLSRKEFHDIPTVKIFV